MPSLTTNNVWHFGASNHDEIACATKQTKLSQLNNQSSQQIETDENQPLQNDFLINRQSQLADIDFKQYVKALGKGIKGARSLTFDEAQALIQGFSFGLVSRAQMASAMMLMRVRGETTSEMAGVAAGLKQLVDPRWQQLSVDIDWPVYAGKREQLPWLLLAAKTLAAKGLKICLHGDNRSLSHRRHVADCLEGLGISSCRHITEAQQALENSGIIYIDASELLPVVSQCRELHQELGLRSVMQMSIRCINPTNAPLSLRSYFHPGLDKDHIEVVRKMVSVSGSAQRVVIFKGLQGETEINPRVNTTVNVVDLLPCSEVHSINAQFNKPNKPNKPNESNESVGDQSNSQVDVYQLDVATSLEAFSGAKVGQADLANIDLMSLWQTEQLTTPLNDELSQSIISQALASVKSTLALVLATLTMPSSEHNVLNFNDFTDKAYIKLRDDFASDDISRADMMNNCFNLATQLWQTRHQSNRRV